MMPVELTEEQAWAILAYHLIPRAYQIWAEMQR